MPPPMTDSEQPGGPDAERSTALPVRYDEIAPRLPDSGANLFDLFPEGAEI
jgi:hypothetical protein